MADWRIEYSTTAKKDLEKLDGSQRSLVVKAINKVSLNPLPENEGGYGKPLRNDNGTHLAGLLKIKLLKAGIRIIYRLERINGVMTIVIIGMRSDEEVYKEAEKKINKTK